MARLAAASASAPGSPSVEVGGLAATLGRCDACSPLARAGGSGWEAVGFKGYTPLRHPGDSSSSCPRTQ